MSVAVNININIDTATPRLKKLLAAAQPHALATKIAPPLAEYWRDHLAALPKNKHGYPSTGFWEQAARRVNGIATDIGALLSCDQLGLRQRLYGGPIVASKGQNITIPICAEAYGTTVADWGRDNLTLVILGDGRKFFALWLGSDETQAAYKSAKVGKNVKRAEVSTRRAQRFNEAARSHEKPKVIIFRPSSGGSSEISRAERHMDLKFLFKLQHETADQEPNPNVIPPDLGERAKEQVLMALME